MPVTLTPIYDTEAHCHGSPEDGCYGTAPCANCDNVAGEPIEWDAWVRPCGANPKTLPLVLLLYCEPHEPHPWCVYVNNEFHWFRFRREAVEWINIAWEDADALAPRGRGGL